MKRRLNIVQFLSQWGRVSRYAMALCWLTGLLLGFFAAKSAGFIVSVTIYESVCGSASLFGMIWICTLPFLISFLAILLEERWLMGVVCVSKAFSFGYCATLIGHTYGSAGWLIRLLLLFPDCMIMPALILFWLFFGKRVNRIRFVLFVIYAVIIAIADYYFVAPLLYGAVS